MFDFCQIQQTYSSTSYYAASTGVYASISFYNVAGASISSFVHYNKFDQINFSPETSTTTTTTTTTTTATTTTTKTTTNVQTYGK